MSDEARRGLPEVTRGRLAIAGGLLRLPDQLPKELAAQVILTGEPLSASAALTHGLVNDVVSADRGAVGGASEQARHAVPSRDLGSDWNPVTWSENDAELDRLLKSGDLAEGLTAFRRESGHLSGEVSKARGDTCSFAHSVAKTESGVTFTSLCPIVPRTPVEAGRGMGRRVDHDHD